MVAVADARAEKAGDAATVPATTSEEKRMDEGATGTAEFSKPEAAIEAGAKDLSPPAETAPKKKKQPIIKRFFFGSYKTPEEREKEEQEAIRKREEKQKRAAEGQQQESRTEDASIRKFFHDNICQSISPNPMPKKPLPSKEEREAEEKRREEERKQRKPFWGRVKESFWGGEKTTHKGPKTENVDGPADAEHPVQGPAPMPEK